MLWFYNHIFLFLKQMFFSPPGLYERPTRAAGEAGGRAASGAGLSAHRPSPLIAPRFAQRRQHREGRSVAVFRRWFLFAVLRFHAQQKDGRRYFCRFYSRSVYLKQTSGLPSGCHPSVKRAGGTRGWWGRGVAEQSPAGLWGIWVAAGAGGLLRVLRSRALAEMV